MGTTATVLPATRLVCTIGPASAGRIPQLVAAGMSVARLNLSHGDRPGHAAAIAAVRAAADAAGRPVAVLADLPGPKVRLGAFVTDAVELEAGGRLVLRTGDPEPGDARGVTTTHAGLAGDLRIGDRVLLADGAAELRVTSTSGDVVTVVERGGLVRSHTGVAVPSERLSLPAISDHDRELAAFACAAGVDFIGQSFVRGPEDVRRLRAILGDDGPAIVAKIETRAGAARVEEVLEVADALMVARGDLGVELPFEEVPLVQLRLVAAARRAGRPVIIATQMLESMVAAPRPTRAEASDVANAVLDGADAVMLSAETAIGAHPVLVAETALRIASAAERDPARPPVAHGEPLPVLGASPDAAGIAIAAAALADADADVDAIVAFTRTGRTARLIAARRPRVPIVAVTPDPTVARRLALSRGLAPHVGPEDPVAAVEGAIADLRARHVVGGGRAVVVVATSAGGGGGPNVVEVRRVD